MAEVAAKTPGDILAFHFGISGGITPRLMTRIAPIYELDPAEADQLNKILEGLYKIFVEKDATIPEINTLAHSSTGFEAVDAKFTIDSAARKRLKDLFERRDSSDESARGLEAEKYSLIYVRLEGNMILGKGPRYSISVPAIWSAHPVASADTEGSTLWLL